MAPAPKVSEQRLHGKSPLDGEAAVPPVMAIIVENAGVLKHREDILIYVPIFAIYGLSGHSQSPGSFKAYRPSTAP
jgi:hypothetical protein